MKHKKRCVVLAEGFFEWQKKSGQKVCFLLYFDSFCSSRVYHSEREERVINLLGDLGNETGILKELMRLMWCGLADTAFCEAQRWTAALYGRVVGLCAV